MLLINFVDLNYYWYLDRGGFPYYRHKIHTQGSTDFTWSGPGVIEGKPDVVNDEFSEINHSKTFDRVTTF